MSETTPQQDSPFVTGDDMFSHFAAGQRMTVLDSHWAKTENSAWEAYVGQHIPGAMFCNPLVHLADLPTRQRGRNPLPNVDDLQRSFRDWGFSEDRPIFIYDAGPNIYAARAWWVIRWAGLNNVHILNGGTPAWEAAGGDVAGGIGALRGRGDAVVKPGNMPELCIDDVEDWVSDHLLIDAREEGRHQGVKESFDHQAGHIPGSLNIPVTRLADSNGKILAPEQLRAMFKTEGITEGSNVAVYSGSGLHSSLFIAALEHAGLTGARHFVGGWSQWAADSSRPIERG